MIVIPPPTLHFTTFSAVQLLAFLLTYSAINPSTLESNPSAQRCLPSFSTGDFNF
jgi:hypothetical protein